jgi:hypothetical protein
VVLEPVRLISGEAGIGTPHLMHAALEVAEAEECVVLGGRATTTTLGWRTRA